MKISLKYKFLFVLLGVPTVALFLYLQVAKDLFTRDKISYVMNSLEVTSSNISQLVELQLVQLNLITQNFEDFLQNFDSRLSNSEHAFIIGMYKYESTKPEQFSYATRISKSNVDVFNQAVKKLINDSTSKKGLVSFKDNLAFYFPQNWNKKYVYLVDLEKLVSRGRKDSYYNVEILTNNTLTSKALEQVTKNPEEAKKKLNSLAASSLSTMGFSSDDKFVSLTKSVSDITVMVYVSKSKAMKILSELQTKSFYYYLLFIAIAGCLAIIVTLKLTNSIKKLHAATQQLGDENYNLAIKINSRDEIGDLAKAFVKMSEKIHDLLEKLRLYNEQLEQIVRERTLKLRHALSLQNSMVESLQDGFFLIDANAKVTDVYSKSTNTMFNKDIVESKVGSFMAIDSSEEEFNSFFNVIFDEMLPFKDAIDLLPQSLMTEEGKYLEFKYGKILVSDSEDLISSEGNQDSSQTIYRIVCVVSDKTDELKYKKLLEQEQEFAQTVVSITNSNEAYDSLIRGLLQLICRVRDHKFLLQNVAEVYREAHTIKAHCMFLGLKKLAGIIHELESELSRIKDDNNRGTSDLYVMVDRLESDLQSTVDRFISLTGVGLDGKESFRKISYNSLVHMANNVNAVKLPTEVTHKILAPIFLTSIKDVLLPYQKEVDSMALAKNLSGIKYFIQGDAYIYFPVYCDYINSLIHLIRNSIDHGADIDRELDLSFHIKQDDNLMIIYRDNGSGVDKKKILAKAQSYDDSVTEDNIDILHWLSADFFSTSDGVSMTSGRGVGLGSVVSEVEKLGGVVSLLDHPGFVLKMVLPLIELDDQVKLIYKKYSSEVKMGD